MEADQRLSIAAVAQDNECEFWDVLRADPYPHVRVAHVDLRHEDWAKKRVGGDNLVDGVGGACRVPNQNSLFNLFDEVFRWEVGILGCLHRLII